jgi:hypothetical protein
MIDDIKKSVNSILYERTHSPFFGTLICSWGLWNWKIVYLTFFVSEKKIATDKIEYISTKLLDIHRLTTYPLISTIILLTVVPFITNGAYWLSLQFTKWRKDQKIKIDKQQLLTLEQSMELREQVLEQEIRFDKLLKNKNLEIDQLKIQIAKDLTPIEGNKKVKTEPEKDSEATELKALSERIKNNPTELLAYETTLVYIQGGHGMTSVPQIGTKFINLLESYGIIQSKGNGIYQFTPTGKRFNKMMT